MKALFGRSKATFKPVKAHRNKKRSELSTMMKATLGTALLNYDVCLIHARFQNVFYTLQKTNLKK